MSAPKVDLDQIVTHLSKQPDVVAAYLFGSVAREQANTMSDVDIAILFQQGLDEETALERQLAILLALETMADREVQVTVLNRVAPFFAFQVIKEGKRLYERDKAERVEFEVRVMKDYFDVQPMLEFQNRALIQRIKETGLGRKKRGASRTLEAAARIQERLTGISGR
ncbi:MAG: hypothetical protein Fur0022_10790 [Anaerolineales bacterium]